LTGMRLVAVNLQRQMRGGGASERRRRTATFVYSSLLHHHRYFSDGRTVKWYFGNISHRQIKLIALSLFTRRRHVARSANYRGHGPGARSLQWNAICCAGRSVIGTLRQRSPAAGSVLFILQMSPASLLTDTCS